MKKLSHISDAKPHVHGKTVCLGCNHIGWSVAPLGVNRLECERCKKMTMVWANYLTNAEFLCAYKINRRRAKIEAIGNSLTRGMAVIRRQLFRSKGASHAKI